MPAPFATFKRLKRIPVGYFLGRLSGAVGQTGDCELLPFDEMGAILDLAAEDITFDPVASGLVATNVQDAIDELVTLILAAVYTNEMAQDAVGNILLDSATIDFTYNDGVPSITASVIDGSITFAKMQAITDGRLLGASGGTTIEEITVGSGLSLVANNLTATVTQYTDEMAQDAVGGILVDTASINFTYNDGANTITADFLAAAASLITFTPYTHIAATTVQAAIEEVVDEFVSKVRTGTETIAASLSSTGSLFSLTPAIGVQGSYAINTEGLVLNGLFFENFRSSVDPPGMTATHNRGTRASPTALLLNDRMISIGSQGRYGTGANDKATTMAFYSRVIAATPSSTDMNTEVVIDTCPSGSITASRLFQISHSVGLQLYGAGQTVIDPDRVFRSRGFTVATLPAGVTGKRCHVTDALAPVALAVVAGGGAAVVPVFYNGANWIVA